MDPVSSDSMPVRPVLKDLNSIEASGKANLKRSSLGPRNSSGGPSHIVDAHQQHPQHQPSSLPDIVFNATNTNSEGQQIPLDYCRRSSINGNPNPNAYEPTNGGLVVPMAPLHGGSYASSEDEAFVECDSFADEASLLRIGSNEHIPNILNETELLDDTRIQTPISDEMFAAGENNAANCTMNMTVVTESAQDYAGDETLPINGRYVDEHQLTPLDGNAGVDSKPRAALDNDITNLTLNVTVGAADCNTTMNTGDYNGNVTANVTVEVAECYGNSSAFGAEDCEGNVAMNVTVGSDDYAGKTAAVYKGNATIGSAEFDGNTTSTVGSAEYEGNAAMNVTVEAGNTTINDIVNAAEFDGNITDTVRSADPAAMNVTIGEYEGNATMNETVGAAEFEGNTTATLGSADSAGNATMNMPVGAGKVNESLIFKSASPRPSLQFDDIPIVTLARMSTSSRHRLELNNTASYEEDDVTIIANPNANATADAKRKSQPNLNVTVAVATSAADCPAEPIEPNYEEFDVSMQELPPPMFESEDNPADMFPNGADSPPGNRALQATGGELPCAAASDAQDDAMEVEDDEDGFDLPPPFRDQVAKAPSPMPQQQSFATTPVRVESHAENAVTSENGNACDPSDDEFKSTNRILDSADFDYLLSKDCPNSTGNRNQAHNRQRTDNFAQPSAFGGQSSTALTVPGPNSRSPRDSVLLRFDPLQNRPNTLDTPHLSNEQLLLSPTIEEHRSSNNKQTLTTVPAGDRFMHEPSSPTADKTEAAAVAEPKTPRAADEQLDETVPLASKDSQSADAPSPVAQAAAPPAKTESQPSEQPILCVKTEAPESDAKMSAELIQDLKIAADGGDVKAAVATSSNKNKIEELERKLLEAESREESYLRRIGEKDKILSKITAVVESYEKAIAELVGEREQLRNASEAMKQDRDANFEHLTSLETTFSDLHTKYERSKQMTAQLKESEEQLIKTKVRSMELLKGQEIRYEKMKQHALAQLEIANKQLEKMTKDHRMEIAKMRLNMKREEIARTAMQDQLTQKIKENNELMNICDELMSGQQS